MFSRISEIITGQFEEKQIISSEERELYRYGVQQGFTILLNLATTVLIGVICGMVWQSLLFLVAYIPLRSYAGGYHEKTPTRCYVFSIVLMFAVLLAMKHIPFDRFICGILLFISSVLILFLAPVEDHNKPLDQTEQKVYRKRALMIWILEMVCAVISYMTHWTQVFLCITVTLVVMALMLVLGQLKNNWFQRHQLTR